ncbi:MAG: hypothetical protein CL916_13850 [Deltaproteobacteria bacterium]|nr:hypothetical protein [Deltaproteobacteria bacterium]
MKSKKRKRVHLRTERKKRGWSARHIYEQTKVPLRYIEALETGNMESVQKGSRLLEARMRYLTLLNLPLDSKITFVGPNMYSDTETTGNLQTEGASKTVAYSIILVMIAVICIKLTGIIVDAVQNDTPLIQSSSIEATASSISTPAPVPTAHHPDFRLYTTGNVFATITVDGKEVHNDTLTPNKRYNFDFTKKIEIWSNNVSLLHVELHGKRIAPQGSVANERKLIFAIDRASL